MTFPIYGKIKFMFQTTNQISFEYGKIKPLLYAYIYHVIISKLGPRMFKNQDVRLRALQAPEGIHHIFRAEADEATATYSRCPLHG
jgi:hypothetical protein